MILGRTTVVDDLDRPDSSVLVFGGYTDIVSSGGTWSAKLEKFNSFVSVKIVSTTDFLQDDGHVTTGPMIPVGFRPQSTRIYTCPLRSNGSDIAGRVEVLTDGNMSLKLPDGDPVIGVCGFVDDADFFYTL